MSAVHPKRRSELLSCLLATLLVLLCHALSAQSPITFHYFYDDLNQLTRVVDSTGVMIKYVYDPVGNMQQVIRSTVASGALTVFNVTPSYAPLGATVIIQGQGFSPIASVNIVTFNGVNATVLSATATTLVVQVPPNATSGPVVVKVGSATTTYDSSFQVLPLPSITAVAPKVIFAGTNATLTVTGANLANATFELTLSNPTAPLPINSVSIDPTGTTATLSFTIPTSLSTYCTVVGTNFAGSSSSIPVVGFVRTVTSFNTFSIPGPDPNGDPDQDGLTNAQEIMLGTNPLNRDTDGDTYPDDMEIALGSDPLNPLSIPVIKPPHETESVGVALLNGAIPLGPATRETESLAFSLLNGLVTGAPVRETESLSFSVQNLGGSPILLPQAQLTNPKAGEPSVPPTSAKNNEPPIHALIDSDADGLPDWVELLIGTDPFNSDSDGDGLSDGDEVLLYHTNPLQPDTDGDGYGDGDEVKAGSDPLKPLSTPLFPHGSSRSSPMQNLQNPAVRSPQAIKRGDNYVNKNRHPVAQVGASKVDAHGNSFRVRLFRWWKFPSTNSFQ